jgi:TRAP-type C4-dicarboxylate transport system permease small subunit
VVPLMNGVPVRRVLHFIGFAITLVFCILFLVGAIPWWLETFDKGQTTSSIWRARLWIPYLAVPVGLFLLCLEIIAEMWMVLSRRALPFGLGADERL